MLIRAEIKTNTYLCRTSHQFQPPNNTTSTSPPQRPKHALTNQDGTYILNSLSEPDCHNIPHRHPRLNRTSTTPLTNTNPPPPPTGTGTGARATRKPSPKEQHDQKNPLYAPLTNPVPVKHRTQVRRRAGKSPRACSAPGSSFP